MINRTTQDLAGELPRRIADVERELRDMKSKQFIGGESFVVNTSAITTITLAVPAGESRAFNIDFLASNFGYYVSEFSPSFFIDNNNNGAYLWPNGVSLTLPLLKLSLNWAYDAIDSSEFVNGRKRYKVQIVNLDTSAHNYYFQNTLIFPKISTSGL